MAKKPLNVSVPENILEDVDALAKEMGLNRTSVVIMAIKQYVDQNKAVQFMADARKTLPNGWTAEDVQKLFDSIK